jgi:hypothetical protein
MQIIRKPNAPILAILISGILLSVSAGTASAALLFTEDFQGHANGSTVQSANGWAGDAVNVNDSANFSGSRVADGRDIAGTVDGFALIERSIGGNLNGTSVHEMSMDVYAQTGTLPSHNNGFGLSDSTGATAFSGGTYWSVIYDMNNVPGRTGYFFDARQITGISTAFLFLQGPFNAIETLRIVLDGVAGEVYGEYDFGGGVHETTHYAASAAQIAAIDQVFGFFDFRSAHPGGTFASTALGTQFGAAQWDNITVTGTFEGIPEPGMVAVFALGLLGIASAQNRRNRA